jgi:hypothetical protein
MRMCVLAEVAAGPFVLMESLSTVFATTFSQLVNSFSFML